MSTVLTFIAGIIAAAASVASFGYTYESAYLWLAFMVSNCLMFIAGGKVQ